MPMFTKQIETIEKKKIRTYTQQNNDRKLDTYIYCITRDPITDKPIPQTTGTCKLGLGYG